VQVAAGVDFATQKLAELRKRRTIATINPCARGGNHNVSDDIERVLLALAGRNSPPNGVSISYLAKRLGMDRRRAQKIVELLERADYVRVQRLDRVALISPTLSGCEKAATLRKETRDKAGAPRASALAIIAGAGLLVVLIGFAGWWFGMFPQIGNAQPANSTPIPSATSTPAGSSGSLGLTEAHGPPSTDIPVGSLTETPSAVPAMPTLTPIGPGPLPTAIPIGTPDPNSLGPLGGAIPTPVLLLEQPAETINIVLMGTDTTGGSWRTDTLILVSVDPNLPSVSMLSIPRDLFVYIPGWQMERINTADYHGERAGYPGGGPGLVKATIEYNLGVRVHYFARANFQGFVKILDTLGGVDVVADCELHDTFPDPAAPTGASDIDLLPGVHHLEGKQALWYARSRWNTSDFDRGRRQQRVLRGAFAQIKQLGLLPKAPELWDELTQTVETDLSLETALWLAKVASRLEVGTAIKSRFIDNTVVQQWRTPEGAAVLLPIPERTGPLVAEAMAPPDTARARQAVARVEVLNGTARPNWAILAADRLLWEGFEVVNIDQADSTDYQQTTIMDFAKTDKGSPVSHLAAILRVNEANIVPADTSNDEVDFRVIVGYDYSPCYRTYWREVHGSTPTQ
jgi:LCP family protein required for cell wall assembly